MWSVKSGHSKQLVQGPQDDEGVNALVDTDGEMWSGSEDGVLRIWRVGREGSADCLEAELPGHEAAVKCLVVVGNRVWSGSSDTTLRIWKLRERKCEKILKAGVPIVCLLKYDEDTIWVGTNTSIICLDARGEPRGFFHGAHTRSIHQMIRVQDFVWSASSDTTLKVWNNELICQKTLSSDPSSPLTSLCADTTFVWTASPDRSSVVKWCINSMTRESVLESENAIHSLLIIQNGESEELWAGTEEGVLVWFVDTLSEKENESNSSSGSVNKSDSEQPVTTSLSLTVGSNGYWYPKKKENSVLKPSSHNAMSSLVDFLQNAPPPPSNPKPPPKNVKLSKSSSVEKKKATFRLFKK